jgi:flagellar protein FlbT
MMYLKSDASRYREPYARHLAALHEAMPEARELVDAANHHVATGALYKALKEIRKLMKREEEPAVA